MKQLLCRNIVIIMTSTFDALLHLCNKELPQELINLIKMKVQEIINNNAWEVMKHPRNGSLVFRHKYGPSLHFNYEISVSGTEGKVIFTTEVDKFIFTCYRSNMTGNPEQILEYIFNYVRDRIPRGYFPINYTNIVGNKEAVHQLKLLYLYSMGEFRHQLNILIPFVEMNAFIWEWNVLHQKY